MQKNRITILFLSLTIIAGLFLRLQNIQDTFVDGPLRGDATDYTAYAYNLRHKGVFSRDADTAAAESQSIPEPDAYRPPGYPAFLLLFNSSIDLQKFYSRAVFGQALVSTVAILFSYLAFKPFLGNVGANFAALLTAISPHLINANNYILSESLFSVLLIAGLALLATRTSRSFWFAAGLILGGAALVRPSLQYFFIPLIVFLILSAGNLYQRRTATWVIGAFLGVLALWIIRNLLSLGVASDPSLAINTLHHGMYPDFMFEGRPETLGFPYRHDPASETISISAVSVVQTIIERAQARPWEYLTWYATKPLVLFQWDIVAGLGDIFVFPVHESPFNDDGLFVTLHGIMHALHPLIIGLSFLVAALAWTPICSRMLNESGLFALRLTSLTYMYFIAVHTIGAPFPRYSIPLRPLSYGLASYGLILFTQIGLLLWHRRTTS